MTEDPVRVCQLYGQKDHVWGKCSECQRLYGEQLDKTMNKIKDDGWWLVVYVYSLIALVAAIVFIIILRQG